MILLLIKIVFQLGKKKGGLRGKMNCISSKFLHCFIGIFSI
jgi:hypothetical protein